MKIEIEIGRPRAINRTARVTIAAHELKSAALHIAFAAERNRTGLYMRRHEKPCDVEAGYAVGPNDPVRFAEEPKKLKIPEHIKEMKFGTEPSSEIVAQDSERFRTVPSVIAVPVSDVAANLLRPCFMKTGFGEKQIFFFEDEPIESRSYWAACFFSDERNKAEIKFMDIRFNVDMDSVLSLDGQDLVARGLEWAVSLVPLVKNSKAVSPQEIAKNDYDLRHIFGRNAQKEFFSPYDLWYDGWNQRVDEVVQKHIDSGIPFETYYHSILGIDSYGSVVIYQIDCELPKIAEQLAEEGVIAAGLLDSGGSCAIYDTWINGYLNHGWYFREPRGAILTFKLKSIERIPVPKTGTWHQSRQIL
ncbi:hypothetical protein [Geobacter sp.]|uniref:hypothetical protein n=1 Tax=Geobacter sp. TaxID=46610 RepID=UPI0027B8DE32|nr:hypothetical protein [Geobacter sp.]